jgi:hypothetical protein
MGRPSRAFVQAALLAAGAAPALAGPAVRSGAHEFGVAIQFTGRAPLQGEVLAAAGIRWVRADLSWSHAEQQPGRYDFTTWRRLVDALEPFGIRALLILDYGNALYDDGFPPTSAPAREAFAAFAAAAARELRGRAAFEIWNEPNLARFWVGAPDAAAYVALARAAAAAIRREDPSAWILGPALGGGSFDREYLEATFRHGLLDAVDAVSIHPYAAAQPEAARGRYAEIRELAARYAPGRAVPIVVSEWGYPVADVGEARHADYLARALAVNQESGVALTIWYNWQDPVIPWSDFGLLDVLGRPRPAYRLLEGLAAAARR